MNGSCSTRGCQQRTVGKRPRSRHGFRHCGAADHCFRLDLGRLDPALDGCKRDFLWQAKFASATLGVRIRAASLDSKRTNCLIAATQFRRCLLSPLLSAAIRQPIQVLGFAHWRLREITRRQPCLAAIAGRRVLPCGVPHDAHAGNCLMSVLSSRPANQWRAEYGAVSKRSSFAFFFRY